MGYWGDLKDENEGMAPVAPEQCAPRARRAEQVPDITREAKLRAALVRALEHEPGNAELGDFALVVAKVVRSHTWDSAVRVLELAALTLRMLDVGQVREDEEGRKG